jgi:hypothetical protein
MHRQKFWKPANDPRRNEYIVHHVAHYAVATAKDLRSELFGSV